jgi:hypothetical protein
MSSKAKSGLSAVRQFVEKFFGLQPPNTFSVGAPSFTSNIHDGQGHSSIHVSVTNNTQGSLQVLMAWRPTGPFVQIFQKTTAVDPESGLHVAEVVCPVVRRYVKVRFTPSATPPGLGANFELGSYFLPRADSPIFESPGGASSSSVISGIVPGTTITTPADIAVAPGATVALPAVPPGTRRRTIQVTGGDSTTRIRVREVGAGAGRGRLLTLLGSTLYGGADGAIAPLEVENVAGPAATVMVQDERN